MLPGLGPPAEGDKYSPWGDGKLSDEGSRLRGNWNMADDASGGRENWVSGGG